MFVKRFIPAFFSYAQTAQELQNKISQKDYEKKVIELGKKGITSEKIGEILRKEGIHPKSYGGKISKILAKENVYLNPDLKNINEKLKKVKFHWEKNKKDKRAMREVVRVSAQLRRLKKYLGVSA